MKFCQNHWTALRNAIKVRGMSEFVALNTEQAVAQAREELAGVPKTRKNFDPLMASHWAITNNAMEHIASRGMNPLVLLQPAPPEHPEWECPICYLNWCYAEHDRTCTDLKCTLKKGITFDEWIDCAADEMENVLKTLPAE